VSRQYTIRAREAFYDGVWFRSTLEARVFLLERLIDLRVEYEPTVVQLADRLAVPDMRIEVAIGPLTRWFYQEIKPWAPTAEDDDRLIALTRALPNDTPVIGWYGRPWPPAYQISRVWSTPQINDRPPRVLHGFRLEQDGRDIYIAPPSGLLVDGYPPRRLLIGTAAPNSLFRAFLHARDARFETRPRRGVAETPPRLPFTA